jgi:hypothetical protein
LIVEDGKDPEALALLGRLHYDRYAQHEGHEDLVRATALYREAFEMNPSEVYHGLQALDLLLRRDDQQSRDQAADLLPRVASALHESHAGYPEDSWDFWDVAANLRLAMLAGDWDAAEQSASIALTKASDRWMIESILPEVERAIRMAPEEGSQRATRILSRLLSAGEGGHVA